MLLAENMYQILALQKFIRNSLSITLTLSNKLNQKAQR